MRLEDATILVVDDEQDLREIFAGWLTRKGCKTLTAANGAEALKILETEKIDVLVSDIRMPVMSGVALVRCIYEMKLVIPSIIFVSGFGDVDPREMYGLGVEALMEKPLGRKDLLSALEGSLIEREQLWLTPPAEPAEQSVAVERESLGEAMHTCGFQLGRGGCCFITNHPLEAEKTIDLSIHFAREGLSLKARGKVRWVDKETVQAGMSFEYLYPECREWIIEAIRNGAYCSFIPQCLRNLSGDPLTKDARGSLPVPDLVGGVVT
jgi:CheY-like chemotaxis protein